MSTNNRVVPAKHVLEELVLNPAELPEALAPREAGFANDRLAELRRYVKSKICYHEAALPDATVVGQTKKKAYQADIHTLMEKRWVTWREKPYGGEDLPAAAVGNPFTEFFEAPPVVIKKKRKTFRELLHTRYRAQCPSCDGQGTKYCTHCSGTGRVIDIGGKDDKVCSHCHGRGRTHCHRCAMCGYIIRWAIVNVQWNTVHSVSYHQNTFLPNKRIHKAGAKQPFYTGEEEYDQPTEQVTQDKYLIHLKDLVSTIEQQSVVNFWLIVEKQYFDKHVHKLKENMQIRRMRVLIEQLDIMETDYSSGTYVNKNNPAKGSHVFTFLQYGRDKKGLPEIYENDYPLSCCGCFGTGCACQSRCCIIS